MKIKIFFISILLLLITCNSAYSSIRIGTFGDSITVGSGFNLTISEVQYIKLGAYRYFLLDYFVGDGLVVGDGLEVDMVGLWGEESGTAWWVGEEARYNDNNYRLKDQIDTDHIGWGGAPAGALIDYFIQIDGAEQLFPKPNEDGSSMIIHIGTNNLNDPIDETISHVERFIDYMYEHDPTVNLIICQIIPNTYFANGNLHVDQYNDALKVLVEDLSENKENLFLVDLNTPLRENWSLLSSDGLHPNNQGYGIMGWGVYSAMLNNNIISIN
jgi:hypothetical protein